MRAAALALLVAASPATEGHDAPRVPAAAAATPQEPAPLGPPRTESVAPGADIQAVVRSLPAGSGLVLLPGEHRGPLVIDRPLHVSSPGGAVLAGPGRGTVLTVSADGATVRDLRVTGGGGDATQGDAGVRVTGDRVELHGLTVDRALIGIDLSGSHGSRVAGCRVEGRTDLPLGQRGDGIRLWESHRNVVERNELIGVRDIVVWYSEDNVFAANSVLGSRYGTHFMHADRNVVEDGRFEGDVVGVFVMYSAGVTLRRNRVVSARGAAGVGLGFKDSEDVVAEGNFLVGNTTGVYLDATPRRVGGRATFRGNRIAFNHAGLRMHGPQAGAEFLANDFHENGVQVSVDGRGDALATRFEGNAFSDYAGYDLDRDGYGDLPYEPRRLAGTLRDRRPTVAFFTGTPAAALLDLLAAAFPMFAPQRVLVDPRPAMRAREAS